jgi:hypothetical protein
MNEFDLATVYIGKGVDGELGTAQHVGVRRLLGRPKIIVAEHHAAP